MRQNYRLPLEFFFFLSIYFIFVESVLLKNQNRLKKTQNKCNKNCDNPVYIQSRLGKYLDVAPDFEAEEVIY